MASNITTTSPTADSGASSGLATLWTRLQTLRPGDAGTAARAQLRIMRALGPSAGAVRASAVGGYVELRGTVPSREMFQHAAEAARSTSGAKGVLNFLDIR